MKFFCVNNKIFRFLLDKEIFKKLRYDTTNNNEHSIDKIKEIKLSYILLDNDMKYESITKNGINKVEFTNEYKDKEDYDFLLNKYILL